jgi:S-DNA-T family DNA segregation ATPase FtsK/SpoIIIE
MKTDRGTCVAVGVTDATFELVNTFYVPLEDGIDMVTPVINRAMAQITELRHTGAAPNGTADGPAAADPLADIAAVLGDTRRVLTRVVLTRLAELNPGEYEGWTFTDLKAALSVYGIEPVKSAGVMVIRAEDITTALTDVTKTAAVRVMRRQGVGQGGGQGGRGVLPVASLIPTPRPDQPAHPAGTRIPASLTPR